MCAVCACMCMCMCACMHVCVCCKCAEDAAHHTEPAPLEFLLILRTSCWGQGAGPLALGLEPCGGQGRARCGGARGLGGAGLSQGDPTQQSVRKLRPGPVAATRPQGLSPPSRPPSHMQPRGRVRTPWGAHQVRGARVLAPRHPYNHPLSQRPMRAYFTDEETEAKGRGVQLWPLPAPSAARHVWGAARGARPPPTCVRGGGSLASLSPTPRSVEGEAPVPRAVPAQLGPGPRSGRCGSWPCPSRAAAAAA